MLVFLLSMFENQKIERLGCVVVEVPFWLVFSLWLSYSCQRTSHSPSYPPSFSRSLRTQPKALAVRNTTFLCN
jgi:hypothetical protein